MAVRIIQMPDSLDRSDRNGASQSPIFVRVNIYFIKVIISQAYLMNVNTTDNKILDVSSIPRQKT